MAKYDTNGFVIYKLQAIQAAGKLVSIYTDIEDNDAFYTGFIQAVNSKFALVHAVNPWGQIDGWVVQNIERISEIIEDDDYETRLQTLLELRGQLPRHLFEDDISEDRDIVQLVLQKSRDNRNIISLFTVNETYVCFVAAVDDLRVTIETLDFFGNPMETLQLPLRDVDEISLETSEEAMYKLLYDSRLIKRVK